MFPFRIPDWARALRRAAGVALASAALAGCLTLTGGGDDAPRGEWAKAGADGARTSRDLSACQADARRAGGSESRINQDIAAARGDDWQRSGSYTSNVSQMNERGAARERQYVGACMRAKGYTQPAAK
jgi:predicted small secreted protein